MAEIGATILGDTRFYFEREGERVYLDEFYPEFLVGLNSSMTLDQAVFEVDENISNDIDFDTGADLCVDINGKTYFYTGEWETY